MTLSDLASIGSFVSGVAVLSNADKLVFVTVAMAMFRHYENVFLQNREGYVRSEDWNAWTTHLLMYFNMPGVRYWWTMRRSSFSPAFVAFLESASPSSMPAPTDFFGARILSGAAGHDN